MYPKTSPQSFLTCGLENTGKAVMIHQVQDFEQKEGKDVKIPQTDLLSNHLEAIHKTLEDSVYAELTSFRYDDTAF